MRLFNAIVVCSSPSNAETSNNGLFTFENVGTCSDALAILKKRHVDLALVEFCDDKSFASFLKDAKVSDPTVHIVAALSAQNRNRAQTCMAEGADDVVQFPLDPIELNVMLKRTLSRLNDRDEVRYRRAQLNAMSSEFIGRSEPMLALFRKLDEISRSTEPVLVTGAPGTGKKLVAWSLYLRSMRQGGVYLTVNCSAYPGPMLECELFGSPRRNLTGTHAGALTIADGGTVVLENIDSISLPVQQRLLEVIEARGKTGLNVRIVCLSCKDLEAEAANGRFDRALLQKLKQHHIALPALRERQGDVVLVGEYFYRQFCAELGANAAPPEAGFWEALSVHNWPGNVRELSAMMFRAALLCLQQKPVQFSAIQDQSIAAKVEVPAVQAVATSTTSTDQAVFKVGTPLESIELEMIRRTVEMTNGNRTQAAKILGISVRSLYNKMIQVDRLASTASESDSTKVLAEAQCV